MKYRHYKEIDKSLSEVGFGVWSVATPWWGVKDENLGISLIRLAFDKYGINFFDTADVYGQGKGETILASSLRDIRHQVVIATKFGYDIYAKRGDRHGGHTELPQSWDKASIKNSCEESLKRLNTDYIDIYQLHNARMEAIQSEEAKEALEELKKEGKILSYGVALGPDIGWEKEGIESVKNMSFVQIINNLVEQDPAKTLIKEAEKLDCSLVSRVPHASGLLDGTYDPDKHFDPTDHRSHRPIKWMQSGVEALGDWKFLYKDTDRTIGQAAILYALSNLQVKSVLPNITNEENLAEFANAPHKPALTPNEINQINLLWETKHKESLAQPFSDSTTKPTPRPREKQKV